MASSNAAPVTAIQVGSFFVTQYYHVLQEKPELVHQFYTDASTAVRVNGESSDFASERLQIHLLVTSRNFTSIEIKTINSRESWNGSILVVVSGSVKSKDFSGRRKFVHTFLLAPQEQGYFVLNDMFHLVDAEVIVQPPVPKVLENTFGSQLTISDPVQEPPAASNYTLEVEAREYVNSVYMEGDNPVEQYSFQEPQECESKGEAEEEGKNWEELSAFHQSIADTTQEPIPAVEDPVGEPKKFTYASILQAGIGKPEPSLSAQPPFIRSTPTASGLHHAPQSTVQQSKSAVPVVQKSISDVSKEGLFHAEGEPTSVYVKNLPSSVTTLDILEKFENFGKIKKDGVFVKTRMDGGGCFAFVEFEDTQSAQNAIKASPVLVAGRQVYVEERKPNSSSPSRGPSSGRGRGGRFGGRGIGRGRGNGYNG